MKKLLTKLLVAVVVISLAASCTSKIVSPEGTTLTGVVKCGLKAVAGVAVTDGEQIVYTDENGKVRTIPKKDISKDGLHIGPRAGFAVGEGYKGVTGALSIGIYQPKWWIETSTGYGYSKYSSVAVDYADQAYNCYKLEAVAGWTPVQIKADRFDQHRVSVFAGVGFNWYQTLSQMSDDIGLQSKGWTPYPTAGVEYKYRPFQSGLYIALRYQAGADVQVVQNSAREFDLWHQVSLGVQVNLTRHGGKK
jgi:hypothetical protein